MYRKADVVGYNGNMFKESAVAGVYRRLELYLPSDTGTYGEPIEETFYRLADRLINKTLVSGYADGVRYAIDGDKMVPLKKKAP